VRSRVGVALSGPDARPPAIFCATPTLPCTWPAPPRTAVTGYSTRACARPSSIGWSWCPTLSRALDNDAFELYYQPVVQLQAWERVSGVEALIRWNRSGREMVAPAEFIPAAEETGLITQIGAWVLREACRQQHDWAAMEPELARLTVSVNLSPVQLAHADVTRMIGETVGETGADPERMIVELTESALVENTGANLDKLHAIKAIGVRLALDDFGTGFSSLGYLRRFPFDVVKIDRSFVVR